MSAPLDYERVKEYVLAIRARDGGTPPLASQALVNITLIDMNDNAPVFNVDSYSVEIAEDAPIGASVMQVGTTHDIKCNGTCHSQRVTLFNKMAHKGIYFFLVGYVMGLM